LTSRRGGGNTLRRRDGRGNRDRSRDGPRLRRDGYAVTLIGRRAEPLEQLAGELRDNGGQAIAAPADVTSREQAAGAIGVAVEHFGGIDVLVNNAGVGDSAALLDESLERWEETLRINLTGAFLTTQLALPQLIERHGAVVNVASVNGVLAGPGWTSYCVSKAGLIMLAKCVANDYGRQGVRANAVYPSWCGHRWVTTTWTSWGERTGSIARTPTSLRTGSTRSGVPRNPRRLRM
jgi:NAD(P)-dependent dehydrogenase (short-subunit alcohol dehydrogenase family)